MIRRSHSRRQQRRHKADMQRRRFPAATAPAAPQNSPEAYEAARDRYDLAEARKWGYSPEDPDSLGTAITRLRGQDKPDPYAQYRDRADPYEQRHRQDCRNLAQRLEVIQQRGIHSELKPQETDPVDVDQMFPSNFINCSNLQGQPARVVVQDVRVEDVGGDEKPVIHFQGKQRGLVLNKVNAGCIAAGLGGETDDWRGCEIELYPDKTMFQGRMVDAIRVRIPQQAAAAPAQVPATQAAPAAAHFDDDIPF